MFTGLVEQRGALVRRVARGAEARLLIEAPFADGALELGESIAVDGVCLTVAAIPSQARFEADASAETLARTTLGGLAPGAAVNLERAVKLGGRMGGHLVTGHVDGVGHIDEKAPAGTAVRVTFRAPRELLRFIAPKGSIAVSGVSLTVNGVDDDRFDVMLVPHTRDVTSLDALGVSAAVNLEVDLVARYVARLLESPRPDANLVAALERSGYL